jgi:3-phosphoshikimate 1-carboxyvinyltransferase
MNWHKLTYNPINTALPSIKLPASKSISNRLLILQYLSKETIRLTKLSTANDTKVLEAILKNEQLPNEIDCQDAGTVLRFITAVCASRAKKNFQVSGTTQLMKRPMTPYIEALNKLGADIQWSESSNQAVLKIKGDELSSVPLEITGNLSSQLISGLCLIASEIENGLDLLITPPILSVPYIEITLRLLRKLGIKSSFENNRIRIEQQALKSQSISVEADWSSACFFYSLLILSDNFKVLHLLGLTSQDIQGDAKIQDFALLFGIRTTFDKQGATLSKSVAVNIPYELDLKDYPDLAVPLLTACAFKYPSVTFCGLNHLQYKESNRIQALKENLEKFGITLIDDGGQISFKKDQLTPTRTSFKIDTFQDHRIAMSFALTAVLGHNIELNDVQCIAKSFPDFLTEIGKLGIGPAN